MPDINGVEYGALSFSGGMNDGLADAFPVPPAETDPTVRFQEPDTEPIEHNSLIDTPVDLPPAPKAKRKTALRTQLEGLYMSAGMMLYPFDMQMGMLVQEQAPKCAEALDDLAQKNPKFKASLENMLATSAWSAVIMAHFPIVVMAGTKYVPELKRRYMKTTTDDSAAV